ncbi:MAG: helix-turn-helix domain-containing protein [bacterium]
MEQFDLKNFKKWREERGLTIPYISKLIGMRTVTIKALEEGKQKPQKRSFEKLLKFIREYQGPIISPTAKRERTPALKTDVESETPISQETSASAREVQTPTIGKITQEGAGKREPKTATPTPSRKKKAKSEPAPLSAPEMKRKRGRPKLQKPIPGPTEIASSPTPTKRGRKIKTRPISTLPPQEERLSKAQKPEFATPIQLTNLDLELINRVLSLGLREKLELIARLSQER